MRTDLLKSLRDALYALPKQCESFNLGVWAEDVLPKSPELNCGTSACAIGLASTLPDWKSEGFALAEDGPGYFVPKIDGKTGSFSLVADFLGIGEDDSMFLFSPDEYDEGDNTSPHEVADRIQDFLKAE